ncbi:Lipoprotein LprI [Pandoraea communis]|uniref:Lipoprotein LprI n=1 Tax=Pandoraea communis TaxID=2508297 RepID=A0A5E4YRC7_9BURK|nr:lysozyme inhibitor LprI family protein [Pandoraea communis]VVE50975.1 Lipoprotein LprI [Pandoraea communis]
MDSLGIILIVIGVLTFFVGASGFADTRKVDRRYKTGYKNNAPDSRNFPRARRRVLWGVGIVIVGLAVNSVSRTHDVAPQAESTPTTNVPVQAGSSAIASRITETSTQQADTTLIHSTNSELASNERIVTSSLSSPAELPQARLERQGVVTPTQKFITSFDCARAVSDDETAICSDPGLSAMDVELGRLYGDAQMSAGDPASLRQSQLEWLASRRACGSELICLRRKYGERIGQFNGSMGVAPLVSTAPAIEKP